MASDTCSTPSISRSCRAARAPDVARGGSAAMTAKRLPPCALASLIARSARSSRLSGSSAACRQVMPMLTAGRKSMPPSGIG
ncbi:MAG: hypothetical protein AW07_03014 [Candidatus Accumulibacter sp. SK-11]|nr:MAG: hypothetical protein AW07_03014 [Candidatus Accumulibacter sp. SK-11]